MSVRRRINAKHDHSYGVKKDIRSFIPSLPTPAPHFQSQTLSSFYSLLFSTDYPSLSPSHELPTPPHPFPVYFFILPHLLCHNPSLSLRLGTANWSRLYCDMGTWHNCWTNSEAFSFGPVSAKLCTDTSRLESLITTPAPQLANWQILPTKKCVCVSVHVCVLVCTFISIL